jgi:hypothetical protein
VSIDKTSLPPLNPVPTASAPQKVAAQGDQAFNLNLLPNALSPIIDRPVMQVGNVQDQTQLSSAAHLIADLLQAADELVQQKPFQAAGVLTTSPKDVAKFALTLKSSISQSGLFYESHITQVMIGERSPQEVLQDPKNKQLENNSQLITQQLAMLDDQKMLWTGQVWPSQSMDWAIHFAPPPELRVDPWENEDASQKNEPLERAQYVVSEMKLTLPKLGKLATYISLVDGEVGIRIKAEIPETQALLDHAKPRLFEAMISSGQRLSALEVDLL